jgi:DNA/RNA-binding domain of Phe-tRNA-synthetase-like protein
MFDTLTGGTNLRKIIIQDAVFDLFPEFCRGVIVVSDIKNHPSLKRVRKTLKKTLDGQGAVNLKDDERLLSWYQAHRDFGSNPNEFPPSISSLIKRVQKNPALPYINSVVALFNYISLKYCLPCGGDDMRTVEGNFVLGLSDGTESFIPLGAELEESPVDGEVIYFDDRNKNVMCRRWNWRNGDRTKIEETTTNIVINIDCLPPHTMETAIEARDEMAELLQQHCDATLTTGLLHKDCRSLELTL